MKSRHPASRCAGRHVRILTDVPADQPLTYIARWQRLLHRIASHPDSMPQSLLQQIAATTGITVGNLRVSLALSLEGLSRPLCGAADFSTIPPRVGPGARPKIAIIGAGNIPGVPLAPAILLAACGCPVVIKPSRDEPYFMPWILAAFAREYPDCPSGMTCVPVRRSAEPGSRELSDLLQQTEKILVFGHNETIAALQTEYPGRVIGFGHKFSVAYVETAAYTPEIGAALARDVVLYNQQGCLSAQTIFLRTADAEGWAQQFAHQMCKVLVRQLADPPGAGGSPPTGRSAVAQRSDRMRLHALLEECVLRGVPFWRCTVQLPAEGVGDFSPLVLLIRRPADWRPDWMVGHCCVQVVAVSQPEDMFALLAPFQHALQGLALHTDRGGYDELAARARQVGFSYICPPGRLQAPPLDWPNGGIALPQAVWGES